MRSAAVLLVALLAVSLTAVAPAAARDAEPAARATGPAARALERLLGRGGASQVELRTIPKGTGPDRFRVSAERGRLVVAGTSPAVQLTGFGRYLREVAHANVAIGGTQLDLPARLPLPSAPIEADSSVVHRFALNDTNEGYAARI
ncbi:alpha-N-acetylglucosaminidase N-terminal domain-containing protein [Actinomadura luteofluorescens]|uniref:alpha-N-acetylglucosaminidase N-terminal domain-containing protein n=1 Tax=Actinomadura luteofluorescens TaxID=46163 RepID=UPI00363597EF